MGSEWPNFVNIKTPYNKCQSVSGPVGSEVSQVEINKIAAEMDQQTSKKDASISDKCSELLEKMPTPNISNDGNTNIERKSELEKLIASGYKPLEKVDGEWRESSTKNNKLILE